MFNAKNSAENADPLYLIRQLASSGRYMEALDHDSSSLNLSSVISAFDIGLDAYRKNSH